MEVQLKRDQTEVLAILSDMIEKHEALVKVAFSNESKAWHERTANLLRNLMDALFVKIGALKIQEPEEKTEEPSAEDDNLLD